MREKGGSNGFCLCYFLSIFFIYVGISIFNYICMCGLRGGGVFKFFIFIYIKIIEKGFGFFWEKFLDLCMNRGWLKCM